MCCRLILDCRRRGRELGGHEYVVVEANFVYFSHGKEDLDLSNAELVGVKINVNGLSRCFHEVQIF